VKDYGKSIRRKYRVKSRLQLISALLSSSLKPVSNGQPRP
jgi:DNA-binding CsgD family transcriptional regulator